MCDKIDKLKQICIQFRKAIFKCGLNNMPIGLRMFPLGACGDTCLLLGRYLYEMGFGVFNYVCGELGEVSHAWLEKDGVIVDITADQFDGVTDEVIVSKNSSFHNRFEEDYRHPYDDGYGNGDYVDIELLPAYKKIIDCLEEEYKPF